MPYILPNGKELKRGKWVKNKISPTKVGTVHKRLLSILFDISETTVSRQFSKMRLSLKNPYAVREYIEWKLEYNGWELWSSWKTIHEEYDKKVHERKLVRRNKTPHKRTPQVNEWVERWDKILDRNKS